MDVGYRTIICRLLLTGLLAGTAVTAAAQSDSAEGLILSVALAQDLAREALDDAVQPIGSLLNHVGPSSVFAAGERGFGAWSLSVGFAASEFKMTSPDYTLDDPRGDDRIEGGVGAAYADLSLGLFAGFPTGSSTVTTAGSIDLLLRLGATLGDQDDLAEEIDLGSWAPIFGGGLRIGLLDGPSLPSVSIAAGANHFARRTFAVLVDIEDEDAEVALDFEQTTVFALLEVGKSFGWITPYAVAGATHHRLKADYVAEVIYGDGSATIDDAVDNGQTISTVYGGVEFGGGLFRLDLEAGVADDEPFGRLFFRFTS